MPRHQGYDPVTLGHELGIVDITGPLGLSQARPVPSRLRERTCRGPHAVVRPADDTEDQFVVVEVSLQPDQIGRVIAAAGAGR